jgi:hypothetical protein
LTVQPLAEKPILPPKRTYKVIKSDGDRSNFDLLKAVKLRFEHRLTYEQIAKVMAVPMRTVHLKLQRLHEVLPDPEQERAFQTVKVQLLGGLEQALIRSMLQPDKIEKASLNNAAYALKQVNEIRRLESGQSTQNIGVLGKLIVEAEKTLLAAKPAKDAAETPQDEECQEVAS